MPVIDVDTHWEIATFKPGQPPLEPWKNPLPTELVDRLAHAIAGVRLS